MIQVISNSRRSEIKWAVYNTLQKDDSPCLPVKIGKIIRACKNIKLITYSSQIKKYNISYKELIINAETKDSYAVRCKSQNRFCIYYNDIDKNIVKSNRVRWNLAHELGHVILKHHNLCNKNKLFRGNIDDDIYNYLEEEADYFAQLILVPHAALIGFEIESHQSIRFMCEISGPASKKRFYEYSKWKRHINPNDAYDKQIFHLFYPFIFKRECRNCGASLIQRYGKYCPVCGKQSLKWGDGKMQYKIRYDLNEERRLYQCSVCENENIPDDAIYCQICGTPVQNKCTNCGKLAEADARHCIYCGAKTTFNTKVLPDWKTELEELEKESYTGDGFMNIPDEYEDDDEGLPFN